MEEEITIGDYICSAVQYITDWTRNGLQDGLAKTTVTKPDFIDAEDDANWSLESDELVIEVNGDMWHVDDGYNDMNDITGHYDLSLHIPLQKIYELCHNEDVLGISGYDDPQFSYEEMVEWCKNNL